VTALFREVRIPLIRRHTNIVVRNRIRIIDGIADMVQNRWLSPAVVEEHLGRFSASRALQEYLGDHLRQEKLLLVLRDLIGKIVEGMDGPEVAGFLSRTLKDQLEGIDLGTPLGRWMEQVIARRDHDAVWDLLLESLSRSLGDPDVELLFRRFSRQALEAYKETGIHRKVAFHIAEAVSMVETVRARLIENADAAEVIRKILGRFKATVEDQLDRPDSDITSLMRKFLQERLAEFSRDPVAQEKLDSWVRETAVDLVRKRHAYIGEMVRGSLAKLRDIDLVEQIEAKVGPDLQFIRLNGAIVGALVGAFLAVLRLYLL